MIYKADLHTHSTASDGQYSPVELVRRAKERGLEVLALTDHDTVNGLDEAVEAGRMAGVHILRGIELSADEYPNLHILGYGISDGPSQLREQCSGFVDGREARKFLIADFLRGKGFDPPLDEVEALAQGGVVGRPHFAQVMLRHGFVKTRREAFDLYLDTPEFHAFDGKRPAAQECIRLIREAGGKAALAHPYQTGLSGDELKRLVGELTRYGLDAIECYYPQYTPEQQAEYLALAETFGLHITGGSDFHGEKNKPDNPLAAWELELDWLIREERHAV